MTRRHRSRTKTRQINILNTTTYKPQSDKQLAQVIAWCSLVLAMIVGVGVGLHLGINLIMNQVLFDNPRYTLNEIEVQPRGHFSERLIRQAAGLEAGQNLWTLNLPQISKDLEKLPYVSSARVERHFPGKITIVVHERVPVVKIVGLNVDLGTRETFYLDHDCIVLKPREDETPQSMPEIIGLTSAELEPGAKLDQPSLNSALQILDAIDHTSLHTLIDIRTINLRDPLSITMVTTQDVSITFRPDAIEQQLMRLEQVVHYRDFQDRTIHTIDLTPDRNVPVTFYQ